MPTFAYRILPPRADFAGTLSEAEGAVMGAHFAFLQSLQAEGKAIFVGRCEDGAYGIGVFDFPDEATARSVLAKDPAIASGLMRMEFHPFRVVMERGAPREVGGATATG